MHAPVAGGYLISRPKMTQQADRFYLTTPIYYVNDRPHIGHVYSTTIADVLARYHRLRGDDTFMLTGVDEHAAKVATAAEERGLEPQSWADQNAAAFRHTFSSFGISNDDFIRTSETRHKELVTEYVAELIANGDVYAGEYEGWYDAGQEEYVPENKAKESDYLSPVNGKPLTKKRERNYFFRLSAYQERLLELIESGQFVVEPEARRNEVLARIREGLNDVAMSRTGAGGWGIPIPNDPEQTIYVWIDALFNYLTAVDTEERRRYWPADLHLIGKEILWFHTVIWPALLLGLGRELPRRVYAHSFWISEGRKMSKSLGNFVDLERLDDYVARFSLDALRYFLATQGPIGTNDADFAEAKFLEVYNADLANTLGNSFSRVTNMIGRYCGGLVPEPPATLQLAPLVEPALADYASAMEELRLDDAAAAALELVRQVDGYIERTQPYKLAKEPGKEAEVGAILYECAELIRIASLLLWPILPERMAEAWDRLGCGDYGAAVAERGRGKLAEWTRWGLLRPGTPVTKGEALFPRVQG